MIFRPLVVALLGRSASAFVPTQPAGKRTNTVAFDTEGPVDFDLTIPYDAAAKLAYESSGGEGDFAEFKEQYEADAVASVIAKRNKEEDKEAEKDVAESETEEVVVSKDEELEEDDLIIDDATDNKEIAHLQKKYMYWQEEQKILEAEYKEYQLQSGKLGKSPPIYRREGKIDHYTARPVYDQETERIQTEIWGIKERIRMIRAKITEERRVEQVRQESADRIANFDQEISKLEEQFQGQLSEVQEEKELIQKESDDKSKQLTGKQQEIDILSTNLQQANAEYDQLKQEKEQLQQESNEKSQRLTEKQRDLELMAQNLQAAKEEQELIRQQADEALQNMQSKYETSLDNLREESSKRLAAKEQEISSLSKDIGSLVGQLQDKRSELKVQEGVVDSLTTELEEKETVLITLRKERASLRSLVKQSWKVLDTRFKKRVLRRNKEYTDDIVDKVVKITVAETNEGDNDADGKEKVIVGSRAKKFD